MQFAFYDDRILRDQLSGSRFAVTYRILGDEKTALERAKSICVEQTVEFPAAHIDCPAIQEHILGQIAAVEDAGNGWQRIVVTYADETAGEEFPQLLNVIFGNSSILPNITVERVSLSEEQKKIFTGPRYGVPGLRERLNVHGRPLACTALKPMGLPPEALAEEAYRCALGGIDLIKDDHGLMDQSFSQYRKRVELVTAAVHRANRETGGHTAYVPNLSGGFRDMSARIDLAEDMGAGGVMFAPGLVGFDMLYYASRHTALPVVAHPAFLGSYIDRGQGGIDCECLFGQLTRLAGADITVYPNYGGRFALTKEQCGRIRDRAAEDLGSIRPIFPCPAGGMSVEKVDQMREFYGEDVALLIGGSLFTAPGSLTENCAKFVNRLVDGKKG